MWQRFDEMRKLEQAKEQKTKSKKRKSFYESCRTPLQRRKRSLFSISHLSTKKGSGSSHVVVNNKCDTESIGEFSSDDEQYHCLGIAGSGGRGKTTADNQKSFEKTSHELRKPASTSNGKCNSLGPSMKLEDSASIIKWSDSDSEQDILGLNKNASKNAEQDLIGVFESPIKPVIQHSFTIREGNESPIAKEKCSLPLPQETKQEKLENEDLKSNEFFPKPIDSSKKRRSKDIKGGLAEQCRKAIARERSDRVFWKHTVNVDKNEMTASIPGEEGTQLSLRVDHVESDFSLSVLKCYSIRDDPKAVYMILPVDTIAEYKIEQDNVLVIYPPFRKSTIKGIEHPVILCAYYFKVVTDSEETLGITKVHRDFDRSECDSFEPEETSTCIRSGNLVNSMEEKSLITCNIETLFCNCNWSQPVTFSANIIKSNLTIRRNPPKFSTDHDKSILDSMMEMCKRPSIESSFELFLILRDRIGQVALLTLPLTDHKASKLCNSCERKGNPLVFKQFILKDITSISCNPIVLSMLKSLDLDSRSGYGGDACYIFTGCDESTVSLNENKSDSTYESSDKVLGLLPSSQYHRVSFYAHCICIVPGIHKNNPSASHSFSLFVVKCGLDIQKEGTQTFNSSKSDDLEVVCIKKLSTCYLPEFVTKSFLQKRKVFFFQDLMGQLEFKHFVLDHLSRICLVEDEKNEEFYSATDVFYGTLLLNQDLVDKLYRKSFKFLVEKLSFDCKRDTIVLVEGTISGLNDDSAVFWTVCAKCDLETKQPVTQANFYCDSCRQLVKSNFHVQLEVNLDCKDVQGLHIAVQLLEKTVFEYLPMDISDDFNGYDSECIIGKNFGKKLCYISSLTNQFDAERGTLSITSMKLKEVMVAEDIFNYLGL